MTVAKQVLRDYRPSDDIWPTEWIPGKMEAAKEEVRRPPRVGSGEPVIDAERLAAWMDDNGLPGKGEPIEVNFLSGGTQNEIYEIRRGDERAVLRMPPPGAPPDRDKGILREWQIIEALDGTDVPHTQAVGVCEDSSVLGRPFYLMGFVEGWSPMGGTQWPAPFDEDLEARAGLGYQLAEGIALLSRVDWKARGLEGLGRPDNFHERQVDRWLSFFDRIKFRELEGMDVASKWLREHKPIDYIPGHHARRLPVRQRDVQGRGTGPVRRAGRLGDGHGRGPEARPRLDGPELAGGHHVAGIVGDELRRHVRDAEPDPGAGRTTPRCPVGRSTTSTTTSSSPSGSWRSCSSRGSLAPATTRSSWRTARSSSS